ncbi:methyl-CpG-binding domain-containing protein 2-like [Dioscorea cayenensis subsp. rotundata]|uniref:Methyl-CpG-binding domain-containing protein 2-like n=1 Tax=Dioscorea cayennensis subsp. rotundata TaxID=55577 RepID=A0AB40CF96_DIOCR|nr:methyl-CpG-binding domain-containing protein 2-like [Dioscorea cayenensis subsp. rotundata]
MQSHSEETATEVEREHSAFPQNVINTPEKQSDTASVVLEDTVDRSFESIPNQLVLYDHSGSGTSQDALVAVEPTDDFSLTSESSYVPTPSSRVLPSVGAFTVQCAACFKWRLIPTKEKYEEIRETILQEPFLCDRAREWRPDITCDDPEDISQDGSRLWAIDKPNIAQPPPGWERLLRIRGEGSTRFADIYYVAPSGKRLRSMVEIERYLLEHPEYIRDGVTMSQFSFQIPRPLQENYVRKRPRPP